MDAARFLAWSASAEGRRFVMASSEAWYAAHVAAGAAPGDARAAADRTAAFYTGASEPDGG